MPDTPNEYAEVERELSAIDRAICDAENSITENRAAYQRLLIAHNKRLARQGLTEFAPRRGVCCQSCGG